MFTEKDLKDAISKGIFNKQNETIANPSKVIRYFEEWADKKCKETAKNTRHKASEIVNGSSGLQVMLHNQIMNIRYQDVKPKI